MKNNKTRQDKEGNAGKFSFSDRNIKCRKNKFSDFVQRYRKRIGTKFSDFVQKHRKRPELKLSNFVQRNRKRTEKAF